MKQSRWDWEKHVHELAAASWTVGAACSAAAQSWAAKSRSEPSGCFWSFPLAMLIYGHRKPRQFLGNWKTGVIGFTSSLNLNSQLEWPPKGT
jgi:hypothetical protein